jgi:2-methylisocitrate lyase-like PEP mutase family enzyme
MLILRRRRDQDDDCARGVDLEIKKYCVSFVEPSTPRKQFVKIFKLTNTPLFVSKATKAPYINVKEYEEMKYTVTIYPFLTLTIVYTAIREYLMELKEEVMEGRVHMWISLLPRLPTS